MGDFLLEACVDSVESAVAASRAGANRLELCSNLIIGGTTPSPALFEQVRANCNCKIHVLIRPRFGDFCYTDHEFQICLKEVGQFRALGADGVVIGILKPDGTLNMEQMRSLTEAAGNLSITLHRAFDVCADPYEALEEAVLLGVNSILTSGQKDHCVEGMDCIRKLVELSGGRVDILVGSGVNPERIRQVYEGTGAVSYHMSGKKVLDSSMVYRKEGVHMGLASMSEYEIWQTDPVLIEEAVKVLSGLKLARDVQ